MASDGSQAEGVSMVGLKPRGWITAQLRRVPAWVVDVLLALALGIAITITINIANPEELRAIVEEPARPPNAFAYGIGAAIAALVLFRRRWPLASLLGSTALLEVYYLVDYPGIFPAVPMSVALATAWAAGHLGWALGIATWFAVAPLGWVAYRTLFQGEAVVPLLGQVLPDAAMMAAVLLLGEAMRSRRALEVERERSEGLLLNILPAPIAERLKRSDEVIADAYPEATVMFADLVDFTGRSQRISPSEMVRTLDDLFTVFDRLADRHGLEKIKTIGDAYMVAAGIPDPRPDNAEAIADMALEIQVEMAGRTDPDGEPLSVRMGIDTGPVVAGVIGRRKFIYDLWGDTVNTASRMETHGLPGRIQVTERTCQRLNPGYRFERRGPIDVKGKGEMVTYFLLGRA
jgi:class 3 adenylate cyclase